MQKTTQEKQATTGGRRGRRRLVATQQQPLFDEMRELLGMAHKRISRRQIAEGAQVDYDWLNMVAQGRIVNPGVQTVQKVRDYLAARRDELTGG